nr:crinkler 1 [Plasmopara viticola]
MVTLSCAIVGAAGSAFPVDINEIVTVGDLKKVIKAKKPDTIKGNPDKLQLFLAKTADGAWLIDCKNSDTLLQRKVDASSYLNLRASWKLSEPTLFGGVSIEKDVVHVLVVVPKQRSSAQTFFRDGCLYQCSDPFFTKFAAVDQVGDWLHFASLLLLTRQQKLYIRPSYASIAAQALSKVDLNCEKYVIVTGTPGTGKSVFVYYAMWRLVKDKKRVLFITRKPPIYFDGITMWEVKGLPSPFNEEFWSPDLWCLVASQSPARIPGLPYMHCSILLASTLEQEYISNFMKLAPPPDVFCMPVWSKEELATIAPLYPQAAAVWQHRFECLGGVPRVVLQDIGTDPKTLLMSACNTCSLDECIIMVSIYSDISQIAQTLIHLHSREPYRELEAIYASQQAVQVIARSKLKSERTRMKNLLNSCYKTHLATSLCRYILESYSMNLLEQGGTFVYRKLLSSADMRMRKTIKRKRGDETIEIPPSLQPRQIAERVEVGQHANQLYVPRASKDTALDAWIPQFGGFQMTVGETHDLNGEVVDELTKLGPKGNRLFFLLSPLVYKTFTKKSPETIEQFAILIPDPEPLE